MANNFGAELLFPIPTFVSIIDGDQLDAVQKEFQEKIQSVEFHGSPEGWGQIFSVSDPTFDGDIISQIGLVELEKLINDNLVHYLKILQVQQTKYNRQSWMTQSKKGEFSHVHGHGSSHISGVYYYQTNEKDGDFFFNNPNLALMTSRAFQKTNHTWIHTPQVGKMIMWPGWLQHGVRMNETDHTRHSLAFNVIFTD